MISNTYRRITFSKSSCEFTVSNRKKLWNYNPQQELCKSSLKLCQRWNTYAFSYFLDLKRLWSFLDLFLSRYKYLFCIEIMIHRESICLPRDILLIRKYNAYLAIICWKTVFEQFNTANLIARLWSIKLYTSLLAFLRIALAAQLTMKTLNFPRFSILEKSILFFWTILL